MNIKFLILLVATIMSPSIWAIDILVTEGKAGAAKISIVPFEQSAPLTLALNIDELIRLNLNQSGEFLALDPANMMSQPRSEADIYFRNWSLLKQNFLILGDVVVNSAKPGEVRISISAFNVDTSKKMFEEFVETTTDEYSLRKAGNELSDRIYEHITGVKGIFQTKIAFVTREIVGNDTLQKIHIMDANGENVHVVYQDTAPIISITWSHDLKYIAYATVKNGNWVVLSQRLATGEHFVIADYKNATNSAPAFSPDGRYIAFQSTKDGNYEIYIKDLVTSDVRRLTRNRAIDTEPSWSPDGKKIVFTSDRGGSAQVYEADVSNGRVVRLTFDGKYNAKPSYSADGRYVVTVSLQNDVYSIAALDMETGKMRIISSTEFDESPSIAPNASNLIYATKKNGKSVLSWVSMDGKITKSMPVDAHDIREPSWSPYNN
ncbi:MAG: Tol-Pal system beta propeller repeat protein TolB [Saccharospirillaceae bacterium]|nr:Tol-Pal system beta propeller repeat protein TolB [Pseudomonadales bacterium]NRB78544.1 Tol-Pal system beta propeller repeat protein TolB [Saccharospirillaceae bacterium]